jgi:hypothetical protein
MKKLAGASFSLKKKGGFESLLEHSAPLLRKKGFPWVFSKKMIPEISKKSSCQNLQYIKYQTDIPTG